MIMRGGAKVAGAAFDGWSREIEGEGWAGTGARAEAMRELKVEACVYGQALAKGGRVPQARLSPGSAKTCIAVSQLLVSRGSM